MVERDGNQTNGGHAGGAEPAEFTADELARSVGTLTTTVRMYQAKGLLHPPERRGRVAVYDRSHLDRIRLITDLQSRGHSLAGIADLLAARRRGAGLDELVGARSWAAPSPVRLPLGELLSRLGGQRLAPADVAGAVEAGLVELDGDDAVVRDERFLSIGDALIALGVPPGRVLAEWMALRESVEPIADRFVAVFDDHVVSSLDQSDLNEVAAALDRLVELARSVTLVALDEALRARAADRVAVALPDDADS